MVAGGTWRLGRATCVLESDFGFILNCAFKKSSLFRIRNLGGVKAHASLGKPKITSFLNIHLDLILNLVLYSARSSSINKSSRHFYITSNNHDFLCLMCLMCSFSNYVCTWYRYWKYPISIITRHTPDARSSSQIVEIKFKLCLHV